MFFLALGNDMSCSKFEQVSKHRALELIPLSAKKYSNDFLCLLFFFLFQSYKISLIIVYTFLYNLLQKTISSPKSAPRFTKNQSSKLPNWFVAYKDSFEYSEWYSKRARFWFEQPSLRLPSWELQEILPSGARLMLERFQRNSLLCLQFPTHLAVKFWAF